MCFIVYTADKDYDDNLKYVKIVVQKLEVNQKIFFTYIYTECLRIQIFWTFDKIY